MAKLNNRYGQLIEHLFLERYQAGMVKVPFTREEIEEAASALSIKLPKNLGDVVYSFKYRTLLPELIRETAPEGMEWVINNVGRALYEMQLRPEVIIRPSANMAITKVPDATPGLFAQHMLNDEQSLLTKIRYNRLIDTFLGITCYSLQNHLRTTVPGIGQVETDELYVGVDKRGAQYAIPVQAKGGNDKLGSVQIEQDLALCQHHFPKLITRAVAAQFLPNGVIVLFELEQGPEKVGVVAERHYQLVRPSEISDAELLTYSQRMQ